MGRYSVAGAEINLATDIQTGTTAARPEAAREGRLYFNTTTRTIQRDSGSAWVDMVPGDIGCRVRHDAAISLSNNVNTTLSMNTESEDTDTMHDNVTNNARITFTTAGVYVVGANIRFAAHATGERDAFIFLNGATTICFLITQAVTVAGAPTIIELTTRRKFAAADYIEVRALQSSGGALDVESNSDYSPGMWAQKIDVAG